MFAASASQYCAVALVLVGLFTSLTISTKQVAVFSILMAINM
jgi:hypothetical protein